MTTGTTGAATARGRPRTAGFDAALIGSAQELLAEIGYDRLTLEAVAARSGIGRPALYRRWPDKAALVLDAVAELRWDGPTPDTGDARDDLIALAGAWNRADARRDAVVRGLLPAMGRDERLRDAVQAAIGRPRWRAFVEIIERAARREGRTPPADLELLGSIFPAMAFHRIGVVGGPVDEAFVERVVDGVLLPLLRTAL